MKEQCPKCGNWVEGKKVATFARKMTRGAVKKGSAVATGMAIGSIIPGAGTIIGGALGLAASALMEDTVNDAADLVEELAFNDTEYEFTCPKCGSKWKNKDEFDKKYVEKSITNYPLSENHINIHCQDLGGFGLYFNNYNIILKSEYSIEEFVERNTNIILNSKCDERTKSEFSFFSALCLFEFATRNLETINILSYLKRARSCIHKAIIKYDCIEYRIFNGVISKVLTWYCNSDNDSCFSEYTKEHGEIFTYIDKFDNKNSYLKKDYYEKWLAIKNSTVITLKNDAETILDFWREHKEDMMTNSVLYDSFIDTIIKKRNTGDESNDSVFLFLEALVRFNMIYSEVINANLEYAKAKAVIDVAVNKWPNAPEYRLLQSVIYFEPAYGKLNRELYEFDIKKIVNNKSFLKGDTFVLKKEFYENTYKHFDLYLENPVNFLSLINNIQETTDSTILTSEEQEYLEEVKNCLEEDNEISPRERRLLDRLRTKLNISEERAKELEDSLKTPQLTEDEQEYLEEYKLCLEEDGEISSKERRLLDRLRDKLGISVERAKVLENTF